MLIVKEAKDGVRFPVRVLPRSSRCEIAGIQDGALKVKLTSPPLEGRANEECIRLLADAFRVRKAAVSILTGHKSRQKTVFISGLKRKDIETRLLTVI